MTIAACYLSSEGVVFGADSTTTFPGPHGMRHYNYAQKIFEVGSQTSTLGIAVWGLGGLGDLSYRTLIAQFAERYCHEPTDSVRQVAERFAPFSGRSTRCGWRHWIHALQTLTALPVRTPPQEDERKALHQVLSGGFCLGGNLLHDRTPHAFVISYDPLAVAATIDQLAPHGLYFWGVPNFILRLLLGIDPDLYGAILNSGFWTGAPVDLTNLVAPSRLGPPGSLPLREAVDWVHASAYATIKALKFSQLAPVCGGPVEIAVIATDRPFRWVRHKKLDAAVSYGGPLDA